MKPLNPASRQRLQNAFRSLGGPLAGGRGADAKIRHLERYHGGRRTTSPTTNALSCAAVRATCTWSDTDGLLNAWVNAAARRLGEATAADAATVLPINDTPSVACEPRSTGAYEPSSKGAYDPCSTGRTAPATVKDGAGAPQPTKGKVRHG